ncbi:amino acid permease [Ekhidna sp.]|uniref:amino acid permease n=1 Tax=Ekhidna sp. TaxID=2608089 RepID=UPI003B50A8A9
MSENATKATFGTLPVFMTTLSTILGAILFLRFGYAVGHVGLLGTLAIVALGHLVTIPTAMAVAEIATNQKVEGGGVYYIISRSFGINIGAAIGVALYLSQAISVAFYIIACAEAFTPVFEWVNLTYGLELADKRIVSIPLTFIICLLMLTKGASLGIKALYVVVTILFAAIIMFFAGTPEYQQTSSLDWTSAIPEGDSFFYVFAIIFPAFTGMAAGVGLSGDLKNPKKSIPSGTLLATIAGMLIYVAAAFKLNLAASPEDLANDQLIMTQIAVWGPIIPIGLICATLSSALGSIMVAPRTLQALASDKVFGLPWINNWVGKEKKNEPINGIYFTSILALVFVAIGNVNFVAEIISMFFMVTYGAICLISFLHHFAADPSYRPSFRSKWYFSLVGAIMCFYLMFSMNAGYAIGSLVLMVVIYIIINRVNEDNRGLAKIFQGVIFQLSRKLQVFIQKAETEEQDWRPSVICIARHAFERTADFDLIRWMCHRYGFGTYLHYINGYLSRETHAKAEEDLKQLIHIASEVESNVYLDTMISPSYTTAIAQALQLPSISGKEGNLFLFEFARQHPEDLKEIVENIPLVRAADYDLCVLSTSEKGFGFKREIHIWITESDYENANLMILMGYITMGHPDWKKAGLKIYSIFPEGEADQQRQQLMDLAQEGRLPISANNIRIVIKKEDTKRREIISQHSKSADLIVTGFRNEALKQYGEKIFNGFNGLSNVLFVNAQEEKEIK